MHIKYYNHSNYHRTPPLPQVCELDIIFNFEKAYFILDEFLMGGEIQETSKQIVNRSIEASDMLQEVRRTHTPVHDTNTQRDSSP